MTGIPASQLPVDPGFLWKSELETPEFCEQRAVAPIAHYKGPANSDRRALEKYK